MSRECSVDCESWNTWGCALLVVVALVLFVLVVVGSFYVTDVVHRAQSRQVVRCLDRVYLPEDDVTRVTIRMWTPLVGVDDSWFSLVAPFTALDDVLAVDLSGNVTDATIRLDAHQQLAYQIRFDPTPPPSLAACSATSLQLAELHIPSDSSLTAPDLAAALDAVLLSPISSFNESFALYPYPVRCRLAAN